MIRREIIILLVWPKKDLGYKLEVYIAFMLFTIRIMHLKPTQLHFLQSKIVSEHLILLKNIVDQRFQLNNLG
jgi:hypothetical protein